MKQFSSRNLAWLIVACLGLVGGRSVSAATNEENVVNQVVMTDRERILKLADQALGVEPISITDDVAANSTGGLHDYFSQMDYAWPDPKIPNGMPYVYRDGETNPEIFIKHRMAIRGLKDAVSALTAAYVITADDKYASKAATLLRTFFLDDGTRVSG